MGKAADVRSLDALERAKVALVEFREVAGVALSEATSEVQRTLWWIQTDRRGYWTHEIRRRTEKLNQAKSELYRAQLAAMDDRAACLDQRKLVERAERALREAHEKLERVKKWSRALEREFMLFKGRLQPLARTVDAELPRGEAKLEILMDRLDKYLRLTAPPAGPPRRRPGAAPAPADASASPAAPAPSDPSAPEADAP